MCKLNTMMLASMVEVPPNLSNILRLRPIDVTNILPLRRKILRLYRFEALNISTLFSLNSRYFLVGVEDGIDEYRDV